MKQRDSTNALLLECLGRGRGVSLGVLQRARSIDKAETVARQRASLSTQSSVTLSDDTTSNTTDKESLYLINFTNALLDRKEVCDMHGDETEDDASDLDSDYSSQGTWRTRAKEHSEMNSNSYGMQRSLSVFSDTDVGPLVFPKLFSWDWPFCDEEVAHGVYTEDKFSIYLPFNKGGTGLARGSTKKFDKISESNFLWTVGLSSGGDEIYGATCFWRMEIEVIRSLNMLVLIVSRSVTRSQNVTAKRLKRLRKVYRLPDHYDIGTLTSRSFDWGIVIEASRRRRVAGAMAIMHRSDSLHQASITSSISVDQY